MHLGADLKLQGPPVTPPENLRFQNGFRGPKATRHFDTSYKLINCWQDQNEEQVLRPSPQSFLRIYTLAYTIYIQCHLCKYSNQQRPLKLIANTRKRRKDEGVVRAAGETTTCLGPEPKAQQHGQKSRTFALTTGNKIIVTGMRFFFPI